MQDDNVGFHDVGPESMHRGVLMLVAQGVDPAEAYRRFGQYALHVRIDSSSFKTAADEVFLLTVLELGRRVFLGGVRVEGCPDVSAQTRLYPGTSLRQHVSEQCVSIQKPAAVCEIYIADVAVPSDAVFSVRGIYRGWKAACVPSGSPADTGEKEKTELAAVSAAALCVGEAFMHVAGLRRDSGKRAQGVSLWQPGMVDWAGAEPGPAIERLPSSLLFAGLGHLGQAYLWLTAALPYQYTHTCDFWLQDFDKAGKSTPSTSVLTQSDDVGSMKTRIASKWMETRGFPTRILEREFTAQHPRLPAEPTTLVAGFDNVPTRRMLCSAGYPTVFEAGLGSGPHDFKMIRTHGFPDLRPPEDIWPTEPAEEKDLSPFNSLRDYGLDQCGIALLGAKAVGVPFVGMFAASLLFADILRILHGGVRCAVQDVDMGDLHHRIVVPTTTDLQVCPAYVERNTSHFKR